MAVEEVRLRLRRKLEETFGAEEASILLDRPPGGWNDLVTHQHLAAELATLRSELRTEMADLSASVDRRLRAQTWVMTTTLIAGIGISTTISTVIATAIANG